MAGGCEGPGTRGSWPGSSRGEQKANGEDFNKACVTRFEEVVAVAESTRGGSVKLRKKVLISTIALSLICGGVVSAASLWGTYKGNQIVRVTSDGKQLRTGDVPAISYNGRTMIPINMLPQIGVRYTWDAKNQTVDVKNSATVTNTTSPGTKDLVLTANLFKALEDVGEELRAVSQSFALTVTARAAGMTPTEDATKRLNSAIESYNFIVNSPNAKKYGTTATEINTILSQYSESIDKLKEMSTVISAMGATSYKPKNDFISLYAEHGKQTNALIDSGIALSSKKYTDYIYISTR